MAAAAVRGGGVRAMRSPRVPPQNGDAMELRTVPDAPPHEEDATVPPPETLGDATAGTVMIRGADNDAGFGRLSVAPNALRRKREDDEYNDYGGHYLHYAQASGGGGGRFYANPNGFDSAADVGHQQQHRPFHFSHTPYARGPGYGVHSDHSGSEGNLSGLEAYAVRHTGHPPPAFERFRYRNGDEDRSISNASSSVAPPQQPQQHLNNNNPFFHPRDAAGASMAHPPPFRSGGVVGGTQHPTVKSFHPHHFRHDDDDQDFHHHYHQHPLQQQCDAAPPPPYRSAATTSTAFRGDSNGNATSAASSSAERLRHEVEVLQASFQELQRQYGEKCGEVIVLQKTVEALNKELSEVRRGGGVGGAEGGHLNGGRNLVPHGAATTGRGANGATAATGRGDSVSSSSMTATTTTTTTRRGRQNPPSGGADRCCVHDGTGVGSASSPAAATTPSFYCDICNLAVNSDSTLRSHLQGERHRKALNRAAAAAGGGTNSGGAVFPTTTTTTAGAVDGATAARSPPQPKAVPDDASVPISNSLSDATAADSDRCQASRDAGPEPPTAEPRGSGTPPPGAHGMQRVD